METKDHSAELNQEDSVNPSILDPEKLKRLVVVLKKKQEAAQASLNEYIEETKILKGQQNLLKQLLEQAHRDHEKTRTELENYKNSLNEHHSNPETLQKLETALGDLRNSQTALRQTQNDLTAAQEMLDSERATAELQKVRLDKLMLALKERDKRIAELQHFGLSYRKALEERQNLETALEQESTDRHLASEDKERIATELKESRQHSEQLQRVIQYLRERQEEATLESKQLEEEYLRAQENISALRQQLENTQHALDQTQRDTHTAQQQQIQAEEELRTLQEQFKALKTRTIATQHELQKKDSALISTQQIIDQFKFDKQNLQNELLQVSQRSNALSEELSANQASLSALQRLAEEQHGTITALQQQNEAWQRHNETLEGTLKEGRETIQLLQNDLHEVQAWKHQAEDKLTSYENALLESDSHRQQLTHQLALSQTNLEQERHQQAILRDEHAHSLKVQSETYESQINDLQNHLQALRNEQAINKEQLHHFKERETHYNKLEERHNAVHDQLKTALTTIKLLEKREGQYQEAINHRDHIYTLVQNDAELHKTKTHELQESLEQAESLHQEKDNALKLSHHHLAKKVKECTLLTEKNKELDSLINDLQQNLAKSGGQIEELNLRIEDHRNSHRLKDEQILDAKRQAEEHIRNWEKKYFEMYEHYQNSEKRHQTLQLMLSDAEKKLEKYLQLEALLKNLGFGQALQSHFNEPPPQPYKAAPIHQPEQPAPRFEPPKENPPLKQESLFENQNPNLKRKEHLFD